MDTPEEEKDLPYTILTKVPGKPQMLKLAPVYETKEEPARVEQYPLARVSSKYPLG